MGGEWFFGGSFCDTLGKVAAFLIVLLIVLLIFSPNEKFILKVKKFITKKMRDQTDIFFNDIFIDYITIRRIR